MVGCVITICLIDLYTSKTLSFFMSTPEDLDLQKKISFSICTNYRKEGIAMSLVRLLKKKVLDFWKILAGPLGLFLQSFPVLKPLKLHISLPANTTEVRFRQSLTDPFYRLTFFGKTLD